MIRSGKQLREASNSRYTSIHPVGDIEAPLLRKPSKVFLEEDSVFWSYAEAEVSSEGSLDAFLRLSDAESIRQFVSGWGPLEENKIPVRSMGGISYEGETCETYLRFSRYLGAVLRLAAALQQKETGSREDWEAASGLVGEPDPQEVYRERSFSVIVSKLAARVPLVPVAYWDGQYLVWRATVPEDPGKGNDLVFALVLQAIARLQAPIRVCAFCNKPFSPASLQKNPLGKWICSDASCRSEANTVRVREYRRRKKAAEKSSAE